MMILKEDMVRIAFVVRIWSSFILYMQKLVVVGNFRIFKESGSTFLLFFAVLAWFWLSWNDVLV